MDQVAHVRPLDRMLTQQISENDPVERYDDNPDARAWFAEQLVGAVR